MTGACLPWPQAQLSEQPGLGHHVSVLLCRLTLPVHRLGGSWSPAKVETEVEPDPVDGPQVRTSGSGTWPQVGARGSRSRAQRWAQGGPRGLAMAVSPPQGAGGGLCFFLFSFWIKMVFLPRLRARGARQFYFPGSRASRLRFSFSFMGSEITARGAPGGWAEPPARPALVPAARGSGVSPGPARPGPQHLQRQEPHSCVGSAAAFAVGQ